MFKEIWKSAHDSVVLDSSNTVHPEQHTGVIVERFAQRLLSDLCEEAFFLHASEPNAFTSSPAYLQYRLGKLMSERK